MIIYSFISEVSTVSNYTQQKALLFESVGVSGNTIGNVWTLDSSQYRVRVPKCIESWIFGSGGEICRRRGGVPSGQDKSLLPFLGPCCGRTIHHCYRYNFINPPWRVHSVLWSLAFHNFNINSQYYKDYQYNFNRFCMLLLTNCITSFK